MNEEMESAKRVLEVIKSEARKMRHDEMRSRMAPPKPDEPMALEAPEAAETPAMEAEETPAEEMAEGEEAPAPGGDAALEEIRRLIRSV